MGADRLEPLIILLVVVVVVVVLRGVEFNAFGS